MMFNVIARARAALDDQLLQHWMANGYSPIDQTDVNLCEDGKTVEVTMYLCDGHDVRTFFDLPAGTDARTFDRRAWRDAIEDCEPGTVQ